jgi:hypothetical protein
MALANAPIRSLTQLSDRHVLVISERSERHLSGTGWAGCRRGGNAAVWDQSPVTPEWQDNDRNDERGWPDWPDWPDRAVP